MTSSAEKDAHRCDVPRCDGTRLGHDLAAEFPEETASFDAAMEDMRTRDFPVAPGAEWCRCEAFLRVHPLSPTCVTSPEQGAPQDA